MMMYLKIKSFALVALCAFTCLAIKRTPEDLVRIKARRAATLAARGGLVTKAPSGNFFRIYNTQSIVSLDSIKAIAADLNTGLNVQMSIENAEVVGPIIQMPEVLLKRPKTGAVLLIVEDKTLPSILSAPENAWTILNVSKLTDDFPPKDVLDIRIRKEINRAAASAFGVGISLNKPCVMECVYSLTDLDTIRLRIVSPEALAKMTDASKKLRINPVVVATYQQAAIDGWAPAPTNDVQKAIWDKVHSLPTAPLKIAPEPKKVNN